MGSRATGTAAGAAAVLTLLLGASSLGPAQAAPLEQVHYEDNGFAEFDCDGIRLREDFTIRGLFMLNRHGGNPTPYLMDNYEYSMTVTAVPDTGRWFTREGNGLYKDLRISEVEGTIYQFDAIEAGQPWVVRDMDGQVVMRDRGVLHTRFRVDTKGDQDLSNDEYVQDSWELVADRGTHPGFYADYCQTAKDLLTP